MANTRLGCVSLIIALAAACSPTAPKEPATIEGSIVARNMITPTSGGRSTLHVKTHASEQCGIIFSVDSKTDLLKRAADGKVQEAARSEFVVGARVRAWADVVMESCPGQALATAMELQP